MSLWMTTLWLAMSGFVWLVGYAYVRQLRCSPTYSRRPKTRRLIALLLWAFFVVWMFNMYLVLSP
jgi:hypothetical protein